jgi:hypothetical protein
VSDYTATTTTRSAVYAASLIPAGEVKHIFAGDVSKTYIVFEFACYPVVNSSVALSPDDFLVRTGQKGEYVHAAPPATVMAVIAKKDLPRPPSNSDVTVMGGAEIGYETATDPYTGRRIHGTYTDAQVGVAKGSAPPPFSMPVPDLGDLEAQLDQRSLPSGTFSTPVAGFLYFPARELKKNSDGRYTLEYLGSSGERATLQVPVRTRK